MIKMAARRQIACSGRARSGSIQARDRTDETPGTDPWRKAHNGRPELAPFYCRDCAQNYCRADWRTYVLFDEGSTTAPWADARAAMST